MTTLVIDLGTASLGGFFVKGSRTDSLTGYSVASAGDVNGDGIDDLIIGALFAAHGGIESGSAFVVFGKAGAARGQVDVGALGSNGFTIQGDASGDIAGFSVSSAGDINGDGVDDLIVGAPEGDDGGGRAGEVYVVFGKAGAARSDVFLGSLGTDGFIIQGDSAGDNAGLSVSAAGDVNGDGVDDIIVGAPRDGTAGSLAGQSYVIFGKADATRTNIDLTTLAATDGFSILGDSEDDQAGGSVSGAGDINGDGIDDLIVGAGGDNSRAGTAYIVFGKAGATRATIDLTALGSGNGFAIRSTVAGADLAFAVSAAGDLNNDGIDDLIVGAPGTNSSNGAAYVIFGKAGASRADITVSSLADADGFVITGDTGAHQLGFAVSAAGDINADGIDDVIIGSRKQFVGGETQAYVLFGKGGATRETIAVGNLEQNGIVLRGTGNDSTGNAVAGAGDVNDDGIADLIIGASTADIGGNNLGGAYVVFGSANIANRAPVITPQVASYVTLAGTGVITPVNVFEPDGDFYTFTATAPAHGTFSRQLAGFVYQPTAGYTGTDSFVLTIDDDRGGIAEQLVSIEVKALPAANEWRLFTRDGYGGQMGGRGLVFGTSAYQNIGVLDEPGTVTFDPSFNRGNDVIRLAGAASNWQVVRSGSTAVFSDGDTFVTIPMGAAGTLILFADGPRLLQIDQNFAFLIGAQAFTTVFTAVSAPPQDLNYPVVEVPNPSARLFLTSGANVSVGAVGALEIFGTSGAEDVQLLFGDIRLDGSFNRGNDLIAVQPAGPAFTAERSGSAIQFDSANLDLFIPLGATGQIIHFNGDDSNRTVVFDTLAGSAVVGSQTIGFDPVALNPL